jgi:flavin-dependent dehydrogenase
MNEQNSRYPQDVDAIVIGAGPAGSSAAATLAEAGRSVLFLERRMLPRFHIGESQLCYTAQLLREMGIYDQVREKGFPIKYGAEFIFPNGDFRRTDFSDQGPGRQPTSFEVERASFDQLLAYNAREKGAFLVEGANVQSLLQDATGRVTGVKYQVNGATHTANAKWVIDAGGRHSKTAHLFKTRTEIDWLRNVAVYRHYTGLREEFNPGHEGDIQIGGHADGWTWAIPIWSHTISIGAVMTKETLRAGASHEEVFQDHLSRTPRIVERIQGCTPSDELHVETDYCYYSDTVTGPGWIMAGDAGNFIDPIFSGGTCLAVVTGIHSGRTVDRILSEPDRAEEFQNTYSSLYKTGYDSYTRLISAYYESGYRLGAYLIQRGFSVDGDPWFARILSGDFWTDQNPFTQWLRTQRQWDTYAPFELMTECPVYPELDAAERAANQGKPVPAGAPM